MKSIALWFLIFTLTAAPWIGRTAYYAPGHNPVYPKSILWWHGEMAQDFPFQHVGDDIQESMRTAPLLTLWLSTMDPTGQVDGDQKIGGWGPFYNILCVPAVIVTFLIGVRRREWNLILLLSAIIVSWVVFPREGMLWSRFVLPWTLAGLISFGRILRKCEPSSKS